MSPRAWPWTGQLELRAVQMGHGKLQLGVIDREIDTNSLEGRYLPGSSTLKAYHKRKSFASFIWELNDLRWGRNPN